MIEAMARTEKEFDPEILVIDAVRQGDRAAFEEFFRRQDRWVRGIIYGVLGDRDRIDDVAQQAWTAIWNRIGELRDSRLWKSWLYRLAKNAAIDAGREATRTRRNKQALSAAMRQRVSAAADAEPANSELREAVLRAIEELPALYREPIVMRHLHQWSYEQIALLMGMPVDSIETRLVRARRMLRESLKNQLA